MTAEYRRPGWFTRNVFNKSVAGLTRMGISVLGSRVLEVTGRKSGQPRHTPVNLLTLDGHDYLVAPRGEAEWVRNVRAADGRLALLLGRRRDERVATEVSGPDKVPVLRAYLRRWKAEVGVFFQGVGTGRHRRRAGGHRPPPPGVRPQRAAQTGAALKTAIRAAIRPGRVCGSATAVTSTPAAARGGGRGGPDAHHHRRPACPGRRRPPESRRPPNRSEADGVRGGHGLPLGLGQRHPDRAVRRHCVHLPPGGRQAFGEHVPAGRGPRDQHPGARAGRRGKGLQQTLGHGAIGHHVRNQSPAFEDLGGARSDGGDAGRSK